MGEGGYLVNGHRVVAISPGALSLTKKVVGLQDHVLYSFP